MSTTATVAPHTWTDDGDKVLILRRISRDGTSHGGFDRWGSPDELNIVIEPERFDPAPTCGNGIHGWPWGFGLGEGSDYSLIGDRWLVIAADPADVVGAIEGGQKCKVRRCTKLYDGTFAGAWALISGGRHRCIEAMASELERASSGPRSASSSSGPRSASSSSGPRSASSSSGYGSASSSSGPRSASSSSGDGSASSSSGDWSASSSSGYGSASSSSGYGSASSSSGDWSASSSSGPRSASSSSGDRSASSSSGDRACCAAVGRECSATHTGSTGIAACIGTDGTAQAGALGAIVLGYWDGGRYRIVVGYVGENGIEADTPYRLSERHELEAVK